jgi:hypothetical protein
MKIQWQAIIVIYGDEEVEGDEQFTLRLFDPQGVILDTSSATGTDTVGEFKTGRKSP